MIFIYFLLQKVISFEKNTKVQLTLLRKTIE